MRAMDSRSLGYTVCECVGHRCDRRRVGIATGDLSFTDAVIDNVIDHCIPRLSCVRVVRYRQRQRVKRRTFRSDDEGHTRKLQHENARRR